MGCSSDRLAAKFGKSASWYSNVGHAYDIVVFAIISNLLKALLTYANTHIFLIACRSVST